MELWTAFLLGLAGSLHCAAMCGPLVLALAKARVRPMTVREATGRLFYHLGRVASYCLLGLALGFLGRVFIPAGFQGWLSIALGVGLLASVLAGARVSLTAPIGKWVVLLRNGMRGLLDRNSLSAQAVMGGLNGLLPCGLVYIAAAGATATGHPVSGAIYMVCFGLGTWPMMLSIHLAGQGVPLPFRFPMGRIPRAAVLVMAGLLILRGLELGIPFVSPNLSAAGSDTSHCH